VKNSNNEGLKFRISAALKNLIGKELITDQYIAIFELVKISLMLMLKMSKSFWKHI